LQDDGGKGLQVRPLSFGALGKEGLKKAVKEEGSKRLGGVWVLAKKLVKSVVRTKSGRKIGVRVHLKEKQGDPCKRMFSDLRGMKKLGVAAGIRLSQSGDECRNGGVVVDYERENEAHRLMRE